MLTLVVPAAGSGSRLGGSRPKALVELGGRPLIDWVLSASSGLADRVVVVIRPEDRRAFEEWAATTALPAGLDWAFQEVPEGSLSAVRIGVERAKQIAAAAGTSVIIAWADQVGLGSGTVGAVADSIDAGEKVLAVPLAETSFPYVWVELDGSEHISRVRRTRDGDVSPPSGLADLGVFGLSAPLVEVLIGLDLADSPQMDHREEDFTYLLPQLSQLADRTFTPRVTDARELIAVNTADDLSGAVDVLVRNDD